MPLHVWSCNALFIRFVGCIFCANKFLLPVLSLLHNWDQLFGLIATAMKYIDILCDETDLVENLGSWPFNPNQVGTSSMAFWILYKPLGLILSIIPLLTRGNLNGSCTKSEFVAGSGRSAKSRWSTWIPSGAGKTGCRPHHVLILEVSKKILLDCMGTSWCGDKVWRFPEHSRFFIDSLLKVKGLNKKQYSATG